MNNQRSHSKAEYYTRFGLGTLLKKGVAFVLFLAEIWCFLVPLSVPLRADGATAAEVQSVSGAAQNDQVNLFNGSFQYPIHLMDVGGFPLTLSYSSNISMESDAGMVGLGWSLNTGAINRSVRGLPDDFDGDAITTTTSAKPDETIGFGLGLGVELVGKETNASGNETGAKAGGEVEASLSAAYNSYTGWSAGFGASGSAKGNTSGDFKTNGQLKVGISSNSESGTMVNTEVSAGFKSKLGEDETLEGSAGYGLSVQSRQGMKQHNLSVQTKYSNAHLLEGQNGILGTIRNLTHGEFSGGGKFNLLSSSPSMTPSIGTPMISEGFEGELKLGAELGGTTSLTGNIDFSYEKARNAKVNEDVPAYGYMYAQHAAGGRELLDVLREKGNAFSKEVPNLPMAQFANDVYSCSAPGFSTEFRPFRGDVGALHDPATSTMSASVGVGIEVALADLTKVGANIKVPIASGWSGKWREGNAFNSVFLFRDRTPSLPFLETVYFKSMGEAVGMANPRQFTQLGAFAPVKYSVNGDGNSSSSLSASGEGSALPNAMSVLRSNREYRQNVFQWLTAREASLAGQSRDLLSYPMNVFETPATERAFRESIQVHRRRTVYRKASHISEVSVQRTDGSRCIFGVPAYSNASTEVSFNVSKRTDEAELPRNKETGLIHYAAGQDNSASNNRGENHLFQSERTPSYVYAWLLSAVYSPDYVDLTGDGPSADDLGSYTRLNYTQAQSSFNWRFPLQKDSAYYDGHEKTNDQDDMAHYSYGSREQWYVHSIETKNYVAEFVYSERDDGVGVQGQNGGLNPAMRLYKLDKITLYTKASRLSADPVPLKVVHFVYDYSLCSHLPSNVNGQGKLTLLSIWFENGTSEKGSQTPYVFRYSTFNPDYNAKSVDRWGSYIASEGSSEESSKSYTSLSRESADRFASAWRLCAVKTPSGLIQSIEYESADYAYVQNRTAMEMQSIVGMTTRDARREVVLPSGGDATSDLFTSEGLARNYLQFKLKHAATSDLDVAPYVEQIQELYMAASVRVGKPTLDEFEKIEGFIPVHLERPGLDFGLCSNPEYAWIRLPQIHNGDETTDLGSFATDNSSTGGVHPLAKMAWETIRKKYMHLVYNNPPDPHNVEGFGAALENCFAVLGEFFKQANNYLKDKGHANIMRIKGAKLRLNSPDLTKLGGGTRVKRILMSDQWGAMIQDSAQNFVYGQEYSYTLQENGRTISSGVAQYEPRIGNEENPFVLPYRYVIEKSLSVDLNLYQSGPLGQIYFPAADVGYRSVRVQAIRHAGEAEDGHTTYEFYTAKDFPTLVQSTPITVATRQMKFGEFYSEEILNATQGFVVELNDMHGKPKAQYSYLKGARSAHSGVVYGYARDPEQSNRLSNMVSTVDPLSGNIVQELVGVDYDIFSDAREHNQHTFHPSAALNLDISIRGPAPVILPSVYPNYKHQYQLMRMATVNKAIYRCGLLQTIDAFDRGAVTHTDNLLRDRESGEVIVSSTKNAYDDPVYSLVYPARWVAENSGMRGSYTNIGVRAEGLTLRSGTFHMSGGLQASMFRQGDELLCTIPMGSAPIVRDGVSYGAVDSVFHAWVMNVDETANDAYLIGQNGESIADGVYSIQNIRSGFRNIINAHSAEYKLRESPIRGSRLQLPATSVLSVNATEYSDYWQCYGLFESVAPQYTCECTQTKVQKRPAVELLGAFVQTLLTRGDNEAHNLRVESSYSPGAAYVTQRFGTGTPVVYDGERSGSSSRGFLSAATDPFNRCELTIRMADGQTLFPDSVVSFSINSRQFSDGTGDCEDIYSVGGTIEYLITTPSGSLQRGSSIVQRRTAPVVITTCSPLATCAPAQTHVGEIRCLGAGRTVINPFMLGVLGSWRSLTDWSFVSLRSDEAQLRRGGCLRAYSDFFTDFPLRVKPLRERAAQWVQQDQALTRDPSGKVIDSRSVLDIMRSKVFAYNRSVPVIEAERAAHSDVAFEGFEDYNFRNQGTNPFSTCPLIPHFKPTEFEALDASQSHTGRYSLPVRSSTTIQRFIRPQVLRPTASTRSRRFQADSSVLLSPFSPSPGKYILSVWLKKASSPSASSSGSTSTSTLERLSRTLLPGADQLSRLGDLSRAAASGDVVLSCRTRSGATTQLASIQAGSVQVDDWTLVQGEFILPSDATSISVELKAVGGTTWYDDLRIQPFNSVMKSYVYDPSTLRLCAELDENNFFCSYVYDAEGRLVAKKRETERGVFTVQEVRRGSSKISGGR